MFLKGYRFLGGAISFYRVLLFSAPSFTFISHRGSGSGSTSSSSNKLQCFKTSSVEKALAQSQGLPPFQGPIFNKWLSLGYR